MFTLDLTLKLQIIDSNAVLIRSTDMSSDFWEVNVTNWWQDVAVKISDFEVSIPLEHFLVRKAWFRTNWEPLGGQLLIDPSAEEELRKGVKEFDEFKRRLDGSFPIATPALISEFKRPLTNFQVKNLQKLIPLHAGANFSVPGAGKTSTTLALWFELRKLRVVDKLLVVAPRSAFDSWEEEPSYLFSENISTEVFQGDLVDPDTDILIVNYEKLENANRLNVVINWARKRNIHLVLDEAHRIKGGVSSVRWVRCKSLATIASRVDLLSGTPMPQGYDDLRNLLALSWPNVPRTYLTDTRLSELSSGGLFVRTTKSQMNLPPVNIKIHKIGMGKIQTDIYAALRRKYSGLFALSAEDESYFGAKGRAVMSLLAAASNPGLLAGISKEDAYLGLEWPPKEFNSDTRLLSLVESYASHEIPEKYKWIADFVKKASSENKKVLIWSNLVGNLLSLQKLLRPYSPALIYGAVDQPSRKAELDRFRNDPSCSVLISNPQTLGEGVSLHKDCHEAIYLDRTYNAGHYLQSLDRIHRLGLLQSQETNVHILSSDRTVDDRVAVRLELKIDRLATALNDPGLVNCSLPDENLDLPNEVLGVDKYDLADLFSHLTECNE